MPMYTPSSSLVTLCFWIKCCYYEKAHISMTYCGIIHTIKRQLYVSSSCQRGLVSCKGLLLHMGELVAPKIPKPMILVIKELKIFCAHGRRSSPLRAGQNWACASLPGAAGRGQALFTKGPHFLIFLFSPPCIFFLAFFFTKSESTTLIWLIP
jgi:hypothetical protein